MMRMDIPHVEMQLVEMQLVDILLVDILRVENQLETGRICIHEESR